MGDEQIQDLVKTLEERMLEVDLLNQISLACEWKEWFLPPVESDVLYVSEVLKNEIQEQEPTNIFQRE